MKTKTIPMEVRSDSPRTAAALYEDHEPGCGFKLYHTPQFKAVCDLLGVDHAAATVDIEIRMGVDHVRVVQTVRTQKE